ncbi:uncharacterized protein LOC128884143 isoform X2 [Hylaeus volcanicus]|nr:uncharacterized protein LOC128884143 isoform X2 [Hylaeus volcanicus]
MYHYLTHPNHQDQLIVYLAPTGMLASQQSKALVVDAYELFEDTNVCVQLVTGSKSELISYNENITEQCVNLKQISTWKFILNSINKKKNLDCVFQDKLTECEEQDSSSSSSSFDSTLSSSTLIVPKVFVFTPEIFLSNLCHGYFSMENIAVIIFDECHHVFGKSVYNEIMSIFYHHHYPNGGQKPSTRILGLTATPFNIVPYAKMNPNTILKSIHDDMHFIEAIYDSKLHFRLYTALSAGDDCFYSDTFSHLNWKYTIDTLLWDPFTLIVTMNAAELNVSEGFLTRDSYKAFIHEIRQLRWCQPLSETSENHSKCWSAKFMKRIKRNKTLLYKVTQLRMRWNTEKLSIQKSIMETWIKFRNQCDIILKEHGLWGVIVLLDALVKSCRTKTTKSQSSSGSFLCNVSQLLSVIEFLETTPTATSGRQWINNYFIFEKKRIKFQKNLMDLFILLYSFFKRKTHIPFMIRTFGGKSLMELYLTHLVSPKVIELEKVIRTLLDRFQPEEYKNHCNSFWKSEKPCHPFHSENDLNSLSVLSNISGSNSIENHNVCIRELEKTSKTSRVATCENRKPLSQLDYYLSKQEKNAFQRSTNKKKNVSQSMLKKDSEEDNDSRKCTILTSYSKKIVHDSKKNLDSEDNQESQDLIYKPFQSHVVSDSSSLELSDSHSEKNHMAPEENTLESVVEFPYYLSNMKCIVFTKTRVEAWLMHQYCQLRGISRTNYVISLSHTNLTHSNLLRYESVLNYSEITNRFSLPVLPKLNYLNILFSTNVLLEGFDVSCCNSAISLNPMRSILDYIQCRGRIREKSNIKSCFKTICPDSVTKNEFILMHRLYDIECLLLKAFNSHQHDPKKCLLLFKPLHTVLYEPTTKACISENCAFREANEIMIRYIRLEDDKICHMSLVILYDHIRSQKTKNFDNSMFPPFKKMLLEYTEETKTYQQMLTEMLDCLEMYLKDHNSTTLLTFIKLLYEVKNVAFL